MNSEDTDDSDAGVAVPDAGSNSAPRAADERDAAPQPPADADVAEDSPGLSDPRLMPDPVDASVPPRLPTTLPSGKPLPLHRYDFSGGDTNVFDRSGDAHGVAFGGAVASAGGLELDGVDDYVELPTGLFSWSTDLTLLAWIRWDGGACWQRVLDFGEVPGLVSGNGLPSGIYLTVRACPSGRPVAGFLGPPLNDKQVEGAAPIVAPAS